jgi:S-formylglutathione hydrolase FrmB
MARIAASIRISLALFVALPLAAQRQDRRAPPVELKHLTFAEKEFESKALKQKVAYGIYLPKDYGAEANAKTRYPLVLWLHGMFEDHRRFHGRGGASVLDELTGSGAIPPLAFVTVNGGRASFYLNGKESGANEDAIVVDLLAHLNETYRLHDDREHRAIMGVSMGGFGALNLALRNPSKFGAVAAHSAAIFPADPENLPERFKNLISGSAGRLRLDTLFGVPPDPELWRKNNPLHLAETLEAATLRQMRIYFDCGDKDSYGFAEPNQALHELLKKRKIPHTFELIEGGGHGWRSGYNEGALPESLKFVGAAFSARAGLRGILGGDELPGGDDKGK